MFYSTNVFQILIYLKRPSQSLYANNILLYKLVLSPMMKRTVCIHMSEDL